MQHGSLQESQGEVEVRSCALPDDHHLTLGQLLAGPEVMQKAERKDKGSPAQHEQYEQNKEQPQGFSKIRVLQHKQAASHESQTHNTPDDLVSA